MKGPDTQLDSTTASLEALQRTGLLDSPPERAFDSLTNLTCRLLRVPVSLVSLVDADRQFFKSSRGLAHPWAARRQTPLTHSFCKHVVVTREPLVIVDARQHPLVMTNEAIRDLNVIAYLGIPLRAPGGQTIGSLCAIDSVPREWTPEDLGVLAELADIAADEVALRVHIIERQEAERHKQLLIGELNHRVNNVLATVNSVVRQTLRNSSDTKQASAEIESRLATLSNAHNLLTRESWESADLRAVVEGALTPFTGTEGQSLQLSGPDVRLPPRKVLAIAMAMQELATNAVKYGALSNSSGSISVKWTTAAVASGGNRFHLEWRESGGPAVRVPSRQGFGTRLIQRGLAQDLGGEVKIEFAPSGVICTLEAPLE